MTKIRRGMMGCRVIRGGMIRGVGVGLIRGMIGDAFGAETGGLRAMVTSVSLIHSLAVSLRRTGDYSTELSSALELR